MPPAKPHLRVLHHHIHFNTSTMPRKAKKDIDVEDLIDEEPPAIEPYTILGIEKTATADEVKSAYRKTALKHHPGMHFPSPALPLKGEGKILPRRGNQILRARTLVRRLTP
jgi:hypothetical protein